MTARAWPHEGIVPLELWDVTVEGRTLFARREEPTFYDALALALLALRRGDATRDKGARLAPAGWESVVLAGGAVDPPRARVSFDAAAIPLEIASTDPCFAARAALDLLREGAAGAEGSVVVADVGQTAIKVAGPDGTFRRPRRHDLDRSGFAGEIAATLALACAAAPPSLALLALPCEVTASAGAVALGASTYPTEGDGAALVDAVRARLPWEERDGVDVAVVNDAVLAAWTISRLRASSRSRLVVTVGLGIGAALLEPASPRAETSS